MLHRGDDGAIARAPSRSEAAPKFDCCKRRDAEGQPDGHCLRSCWIGMHVGEAMGMDATALWSPYYTLLPNDLGCSSNAARICGLYMADDRWRRGGDPPLWRRGGASIPHMRVLTARTRATLH